jgi:hypothetical protein
MDESDIPEDAPAKWMHPRDAIELATEPLGSRGNASRSMLTRLEGGIIRAVYRTMDWRGPRPTALDSARAIPVIFWRNVSTQITGHSVFWQSGDLTVDASFQPSRTSRGIYFGVRFDPVAVYDLVGRPQPTTSASQEPPFAPTAQGGRPRATWWEPLWIEMARQLHMGELVPARLADIEKAMKNWLAVAHNAHPSERTIREAARKLSWALPNEGKN